MPKYKISDTLTCDFCLHRNQGPGVGPSASPAPAAPFLPPAARRSGPSQIDPLVAKIARLAHALPWPRSPKYVCFRVSPPVQIIKGIFKDTTLNMDKFSYPFFFMHCFFREHFFIFGFVIFFSSSVSSSPQKPAPIIWFPLQYSPCSWRA